MTEIDPCAGERGAFEAWIRAANARNPPTDRDMKWHLSDGSYDNTHVNAAWNGWKARAALNAEHLCPHCGSEEWDRITNRVSPGEAFNRCNRCEREWTAA